MLLPAISSTSTEYGGIVNDDVKLEEATQAMFIFLHADRIRFGAKISEIEEGVVLGTDVFPMTMDGAYRILADTQERLNSD